MAKKLLFSVTKKDLNIEYYAAPGPGGQNKNKTIDEEVEELMSPENLIVEVQEDGKWVKEQEKE